LLQPPIYGLTWEAVKPGLFETLRVIGELKLDFQTIAPYERVMAIEPNKGRNVQKCWVRMRRVQPATPKLLEVLPYTINKPEEKIDDLAGVPQRTINYDEAAIDTPSPYISHKPVD